MVSAWTYRSAVAKQAVAVKMAVVTAVERSGANAMARDLHADPLIRGGPWHATAIPHHACRKYTRV